jgi:hypothetical protein
MREALMVDELKNKLTIDGKEYDAAALSDQAKTVIRNIQFVDQELARQRMAINALQTARQAYASALKQELEGKTDDGDTTG